MRRLRLLALIVAWHFARRHPANDKNTTTNTRDVESAAERASGEFKEADAGAAARARCRRRGWLTFMSATASTEQPRILLESIALAPDGSVRDLRPISARPKATRIEAPRLFVLRHFFVVEPSQTLRL